MTNTAVVYLVCENGHVDGDIHVIGIYSAFEVAEQACLAYNRAGSKYERRTAAVRTVTLDTLLTATN